VSERSDIFDEATVREEEHRERALAAARARVSGQGAEDCEDCDEQIPLQRRLAAPWATRCVDCQQIAEMRPGFKNRSVA